MQSGSHRIDPRKENLHSKIRRRRQIFAENLTVAKQKSIECKEGTQKTEKFVRQRGKNCLSPEKFVVLTQKICKICTKNVKNV